MSDTMLHSILQMPPELWTNDAIDIAQRHGRYLEASKRIIELERERDEARRDLVAAEELHRRRFGTLKAECEAVRDRLADCERDRDDAWKGWTDAINGWNKDIEKLEVAISELDEARRELAELRKNSLALVEELKKSVIRLTKERDEALEELKVWRQLNVLIAKLKEEA